MKKLIFVFVSVLLFMAVGLTVSAEFVKDEDTGLVYNELSNGTIAIQNYYGGVDCVIPHEIQGKVVSKIEQNAFSPFVEPDCNIPEGYKFKTQIYSVDIPSNVKTIGSGAFGGCQYLTSVTLYEGLEQIDDNAFMYCYDLTSIVLPSSLKKIDYWAFKSCNRLTEVTVLSRDCSIGKDVFTGAPVSKMYGYSGSTVEAYAKKNGLNFSAINNGDANGDGILSTKDVLLMKKYIAKQNVELKKDIADIDGDFFVTSNDLLLLRKSLVGIK